MLRIFVSHIKSFFRSERYVSFQVDSITQQKKELGLQFSVDHKCMLSSLELNASNIFVLAIKWRLDEVLRSILDELEIKDKLTEPMDNQESNYYEGDRRKR